MLKVLDLFSGIGGMTLGLAATGGFKTVGFCEIDNFCQKVLKKNFPDIPIHNDIKELDKKNFQT
jgi:DNA (cytosine-5)-methyltransferase 1